MKSLFVSPSTYEIKFYKCSVENYGLASFTFKLGGIEGEQCVSAIEAKRIGEWFLKLSKEIKDKKNE